MMRGGGGIGKAGGALLFRAALVIAALTAVARLSALAREMAIAASFGASAMLDAYLIAMAVPLFLVNTLSATVGPALSPHLIGHVHGGGDGKALIAAFSGRMLVFLAALVLTVVIASFFYVPVFASQLPPDLQALTERLAIALAPYVLLHGLGTTWIAALNAGGRFALPAIIPAITPLSVLAAVLLFGDQLAVSSIVWGTYIGSAVELCLIAGLMKRRHHPLMPTLTVHREAGQAVRETLPLFLVAAALNLTPLLDQVMAAQVGAGEASVFNFGSRLVLVGNSIAMLALSQTITPIISHMKQAARSEGREIDMLGRDVRLVLSALVGLATLGALVIAFLSRDLIALFFERGELSADQAVRIAHVQAVFAFQLPLYIGFLFLSRVMAAFGGNGRSALFAVVGAVLNGVLNLVLLPDYGLTGIAVATIIGYGVSFLLIVMSAMRYRPAPTLPSS